MKLWCILTLVALTAPVEATETIPPRAKPLLPTVVASINKYWPDLPLRWFIPALNELETCISLTHSRCGSSKAELKTKK